MKTILYVGVGFYLARALYLKYDKNQRASYQKQVQKRLDHFLKQQHFTEAERQRYISQILKP